MTTLRFIGDTHGKFKHMKKLMEASPDGLSVHVGDVGIGWENDMKQQKGLLEVYEGTEGNHSFIRGNHDRLHTIKHHFKKWWKHDGEVDEENGIMYIGGASTVNKYKYSENYNWWPDEEMHYQYMNRVFDRYSEFKPKIVVSHDLPFDIASELYYKLNIEVTKTSNFLHQLKETHKPDFWFCGHWHDGISQKIDCVRYNVVPMYGHYDFKMGVMV